MAKRRNGRGKAKGPNAARAARPAGSSPSELGEGAADVALSGPDASLAPADAARSGLDAGTEPIDPAELIDAAGSAEPADPAGSSSDPAADPDADPDSDSLVLDLEEPDEAFCRHLLENYEWKTTGKRGYDWPRAVERYRSQHPMELEILPSLQETTNFLTGNIEAGVRFSAAMQTLFPVGTSIHGDKAIVAAASKQPKRATRPSRYIGGPTTMALWDYSSTFVVVTAEAAEAARTASVQMGFPMGAIFGVLTGRCVCVDLRLANIPSPIDDLPVVGALMHMTTIEKQLVVLYDLLMEKGDRFDLVSVPLYYMAGSFDAGCRQRDRILAKTPLDNPIEPGAYDWINESAWLETAPLLDKMFAMVLTDTLDVRECDDTKIRTFITFAEGEVDRRLEERRQADIAAAKAEDMAREDERRAQEEAAAEREREQARQAAAERERAERERAERERDIRNLPAIKKRAADAEARVRALEQRIEGMKQEHADLLAAFNAQGAQLSKEQSMISSMVSKTATLTHNLGLAEQKASRAQADAAAARIRAELLDTLEIPQTCLDALLLAQRAFPDRLCILDQAIRSARDFSGGDVRETWTALRDMAVVLWPLVFGDESVDIPARFEEKSVMRIAMSEGPMTQKDPALMRLRKVSYNGRTEDMSAHVKGRVNEGQSTLRVHFFPDHEKRLLVIGHCGSHLPTYAYQGK